MWRTPGTIYLNTQLIDKDVYVYSGSEMFVEPLDRPEPMKRSTQMQVYVRWWRPSTYTVEPTREIERKERRKNLWFIYSQHV